MTVAFPLCPISFIMFDAFHDLYPPPAFLYAVANICALRADHWPGLPPLPPALILLNKVFRMVGLV